jgi:TonB-dependent Receptor Plug Domain
VFPFNPTLAPSDPQSSVAEFQKSTSITHSSPLCDTKVFAGPDSIQAKAETPRCLTGKSCWPYKTPQCSFSEPLPPTVVETCRGPLLRHREKLGNGCNSRATATRTPENESQIGSAVSQLTGEQLETEQIYPVKQALNTTPGVFSLETGASGGYTTVSIRGNDPSYSLRGYDVGLDRYLWNSGVTFSASFFQNFTEKSKCPEIRLQPGHKLQILPCVHRWIRRLLCRPAGS